MTETEPSFLPGYNIPLPPEAPPIDENAILAAVSARMEAEALAESEAMAGQSVGPNGPMCPICHQWKLPKFGCGCASSQAGQAEPKHFELNMPDSQVLKMYPPAEGYPCHACATFQIPDLGCCLPASLAAAKEEILARYPGRPTGEELVKEYSHDRLERQAREASPAIDHSGVVPLDDFRARLEACVRAGVTVYRDGPLEIRFDTDARKAVAKNDGGEITSF